MSSSPPQIEGMIFDLDGTLADTLPVAFGAFRTAVSEFVEHRHSDEELRSFFGPSEDGILRRIVPDNWERCLGRYLTEYESGLFACPEPFAGMRDTLDWLRDNRIRLGLVTGKVSSAVEMTLRHLNIADYFAEVVFGSPEGDAKAAGLQRVVGAWGMDASRVAYVGDTRTDIIAARDARVVALGAAWATTADGNALRSAGADAVFNHVQDLLIWLQRYASPTLRSSA